ncbi:MAG: phosphatidylglycerophosphatase A [Candidatus Eisenbacteria bacterium]|nr:phosphatidylglycerophosphatase A [Candidatus Eisenbacteria bacterium]
MADRKNHSVNRLVALVATGGYSGYAPVAPGSVGALVCAALAWLLLPEVTFGSGAPATLVMALSILAFLALSIWAAGEAERAYGKDASRIVIDEFAGFIVSVAFLPKTVFVYVAAYLLFRLLDVVKPFPARRLEELSGGPGVVLDDVVAGLYANVLIRIMLLVRGF